MIQNFFVIVLLSIYSNHLEAQIMIEPDSIVMGKEMYHCIKSYNDSISKIKIESDTVTKYKITKIIDDEKFYIIYASGRAKDGNEYQYRIKSDKLNHTKTCDCIEEGGIYQLDIRDYSNTNQRLHFLPGVALNLITTQGFSPFDIVMFLDEKITSNEYNRALNLKGLCVVKEEEKNRGK